MSEAGVGTRKRGRPAAGATSIHLTVPPDQLAAIDAWIADRPDRKPSRPEAIRHLLREALPQ